MSESISSQSLIVSDLEIAIASPSFASLFDTKNLLSHLNDIFILSKDEISRKWLLSGSRLKGKFAGCPQARAVEMGRGGVNDRRQ